MERTRLLAGRYRFLRLLPGRAKGATWMALDEATGASVVASVLPSSRAVALQNAVGLKHERLASVIDIIHKFTADELPDNTEVPKDASVGVAEWLPGRTLHERAKGAKMPPFLAVQTTVQVASVLSVLHDREVAHGALSARAVLVERADAGPVPAVTQVLVPPDGACFAPERVRGAGPTESDDNWALHVMLYMALTGDRPFSGASAPDLARAIVASKSPSLSTHGLNDAELQKVFDRGFGQLSKRPARVDDLAADLTLWLSRNRHLAERLQPDAARSAMNEDAGPPSVDASVLESHVRDEDSYNSGVGRSAELSAPPRPAEPSAPRPQSNQRVVRPGKGAAAQPPPQPDLNPQLFSGDEDDKTELISVPLFADKEQDKGAEFGVIEDAGPTAGPVARAKPTVARPAPKAPERPSPRAQPALSPVAAPVDAAARPASVPPAPPNLSAAVEPWPIPDPGDAIDQGPTPALPQAEPAARQPEVLAEPAPAPGSVVASPAEQDFVQSDVDAIEPRPEASAKRSRLLNARVAIVASLAAVLVAGAAFVWFRNHPDGSMDPTAGKPTASDAQPVGIAPSAQAPSATASTVAAPDTAASLAPSASAASLASSPSASQSAAALPAASRETTPPPAGASACVAGYFAPDTFPVQQDLGFVCEAADPRKGTPRMRTRIVMGSRGALTSGMDEWSRLGWYELVVWATLRVACCPGVPAIEIAESDPPCESLGPLAERTARAIVARRQAEVDQHLAAFEKGAMCMQFQEKKLFKYTNPPRSGGQLAFGKFVTRAMSHP